MIVSLKQGLIVGETDPSVSKLEEIKIVALHGWGRNRKDLLRSLKGLPVLSLDLPGHGASPIPNSVDGAVENANLISEGLLEKNIEDVIVVGHSYGGRVAVCMAAKDNSIVKKVVGTGVPLVRNISNSKKPKFKYRVVKALSERGIISKSYMDKMRQKYGSKQYNQAQGIMREIFVKLVNEDYSNKLTKIKCPVRFVWGKNDTEATLEQALLAQEIMKKNGVDIKIKVLEDIGHDLCLDTDKELVGFVNEKL